MGSQTSGEVRSRLEPTVDTNGLAELEMEKQTGVCGRELLLKWGGEERTTSVLRQVGLRVAKRRW